MKVLSGLAGAVGVWVAVCATAVMADTEPYPSNLTLVYINSPGALCLSGSPGAFYWRPGWGSGVNNWRIHFRGGGWCFNAAECAERVNTSLGNSSYWPSTPAATEGVYGFLSDNATVNPSTYNWNAAFLEYCDGSSYSGNRTLPFEYNGVTMWFRGAEILKGFFDTMDALNGIYSRAETVVVSGTSAGGLAAYLHANRIRSFLSPSTRLFIAPDAGFFLDAPTVTGYAQFRSEFQGAYGAELWNATGGTDQACIAAMNASDQWMCFFAQYVFPFIDVDGVLVINSLYDTAQYELILDLPCYPSGDSPGNCNATEIAIMQAYRATLEATIRSVLRPGRDALWATACAQHEETCRDQDWAGTVVANTTDSVHSAAFFLGTLPASQYLAVDVQWPNNPTCWYGPTVLHGGC